MVFAAWCKTDYIITATKNSNITRQPITYAQSLTQMISSVATWLQQKDKRNV